MRIVRLDIKRFRSSRLGTLFPGVHNVYLGPNNLGKTAVLEALNLLLNPELTTRGSIIDENDFYCREYRQPQPPAQGQSGGAVSEDGETPSPNASEEPATNGATAELEEPEGAPVIRVEAVIANLGGKAGRP